MSPFTVNGRAYSPPPVPIAALCLDGSADEYLNAALARGLMPNLNRISVEGFRGVARAAMPTFTNVNNASIVAGAPPSVHGIVGNYFLDPGTQKEVMMNSSQFLRAPTIFPAAQAAGRKVGVVTAKDKLREILGCGLIEAGGIAFSAEKAGDATAATHGIQGVEKWLGPAPAIYSAEASLYALRAGVKMIEKAAADFLYLSTTDYIQHKHAPVEAGALEFYAAIDRELGRLVELGVLVGLTADHGMNAKQKPDGSPNVIYLESQLNKRFCEGFRVILPITDPYVVHHGALGSFAQVHLPPTNGVSAKEVLEFVRQLDGVTEALDQDTAARLMELPADRMGDVVVCAGRDVALGRTPQWHNLSALEGGLRSHGGRYEEMVPFVLSAPLSAQYAARARGDLRNFDLFDFLCNGTQH
jgi:phosphonoacetate hydrolase